MHRSSSVLDGSVNECVVQDCASSLCAARACAIQEGTIEGDACYFACESLSAQNVQILSGNVQFRSGNSISFGDFFSVSGSAGFEATLDACALAPTELKDLVDTSALQWIADMTSVPDQLLTMESFPNATKGEYPDLHFKGDAQFEQDEAGDYLLRLTGTLGAGADIQTNDSISPVAAARMRAWFRFRHLTPAVATPEMKTDSTLGFERFDLDLSGGFLGCGDLKCANSDCLRECDEDKDPQLETNHCKEGPPQSCTQGMRTDRAHFGLLLDLDEPLVAAAFADGSPCGHLPCSPWAKQSMFARQESSVDDTWHLLFVEYLPESQSPVTFCLDGKRLKDEKLASSLAELSPILGEARVPLRLRVSANVECTLPPVECDMLQQVELDWFALQSTTTSQ